MNIKKFEVKYNLTIPKEIQTFLKREDLSEFKNVVFKIKADFPNNASTLGHFYKLVSEDSNSDFFKFNNIFKKENRIPKDFITIGKDLGGNQICVSLKGSNSGTIYFWAHEEEAENIKHENLYKIADSFEEFLESLKD